MHKIVIILLFFTTSAFAQSHVDEFVRFNNFNTTVLSGKVKRGEAVKQFDTVIKAAMHFFIIRNQLDAEKPSWIFPLSGYDYHAIGGTRGNGYYDKGYKYLDGNKHLAHPAHDIFINDKNQDCLDDKTHQPVSVLAVRNGIVIACTNDWEPASNLRGGKYIWIYHPLLNIITYYAHNGAIFVSPGQWVKQGEKIAEVGRTGYNAYKKRSPTHLHFSAFRLVNGLPVPFNCYEELKTAFKP